ncbi:hypothetical protein GCM10010171_21570 [Actinokineospora fastidiosa]|uniref:Uncharacterized protein n=2 Tax=Actinokineospora fastidiosa TaxID=1816 RepID=A0A918LBI2_9PSEU|nr:hypothetical protein GCM10010171_21570 [Actinokineospora fastidiosa]
MFGIVGVIAGQLVSAHREDVRWRREQDREDLRWERERARRAEDHANTVTMCWRDERLRVFTAFLAAISNVRIELRHASDHVRVHEKLPQDLRDRLLELAATCRDRYAPLGIIGPAQTRDEATELIRMFAANLTAVLDGRAVDTMPLLTQVRRFAESARKVLGVPDDSTLDDN